jgi:DNA-3-methyladenine glycosylase I
MTADDLGVAAGPDGLPRCWWGLGGTEYLAYHDGEWGRTNRDENYLFEMLTLEGFQSGLSWLTILRKREAFRRAFAGWDIARVGAFGPDDLDRLLADAAIVRNRLKIEAAIANASAIAALHSEGATLADVLWQFAPPAGPAPASSRELQAQTRESTAMSKELRKRGFRFVGPTTAYSLMQAVGIVNDHLAGCAFREGDARPASGA